MNTFNNVIVFSRGHILPVRFLLHIYVIRSIIESLDTKILGWSLTF